VRKYFRNISKMASHPGSKGAALLTTVVAITVVGILAGAVASIMSTTSSVPAGENLSMRAYYMAEAGIRYVDPPDTLPVEAAVNGSSGCMNQSNPTTCLQNLAACLNSPTSQCLASFPAYNNSGYQKNSYSLDGGSTTIAIAASYAAGPPQAINITSTATVNSGTSGPGQSIQAQTYSVAAQTLCVQPAPNTCNVSMDKDFSSSTINAGYYIWFNATFSINGIPATGSSQDFTGATISFSTKTKSYNLTLPNAKIIYSPTATSATTTFDTACNAWRTTAPVTNNTIFLTGMYFIVPANFGTIQDDVTLSGTFSSPDVNQYITWNWGAAVYTQFNTNYSSVAVNSMNISGGDLAGTPEGTVLLLLPIKNYVVSGATGNGGTDYTGEHTGGCGYGGY
jgi:Tfp pilus assembly protein PilX